MVLPSLFIHEILDFLKVPTKGRDAGKKVTVDFFGFLVSHFLGGKKETQGMRKEGRKKSDRFLSWPTLKVEFGPSKGWLFHRFLKILTPILGVS